jgi:hypothetical protein
MLTEFEQQFQTTLRARLPAAIRDEVQIATGAPNQRGILCGVRTAQPLRPEFRERRLERVPGADEPRRVLRLHCQMDLHFVPSSAAQTRGELLDWFDRVIYALDTDDVRDGSAFAGQAPDPGFLIQRMIIVNADLPLDIHADEAAPLLLTLAVEGWFWPVGEGGQAGVMIGEMRIRGVVHPVTVEPAEPNLFANGPAATLTIAFDARGTARVMANGLDHAPFGALAVRVEKADGTAGDGALAGGAAGADGTRLLAVTEGTATVTYTPPATPATEVLVLALDNNEGGTGLEIGRLPLIVRSAP